MHFEEITFHFDTARADPQRAEAQVTFPSPVRRAQAMLKGFHVEFINGSRHVTRQQVDLDVTRIDGHQVTVAADLVVRDAGGGVEDGFRGWVQAVVLAEH